jgi:adenylate cyclase
VRQGPRALGPPARHRLLVVLLASLLGLAPLVGWGGGWLRDIEAASLDWRFRLRGPLPAPERVMIVAIDDRSIAGLGRWPPPREAIAAAIDRLASAGASVVALNLIMSDPEHRLPEGARRALEHALGRLPSDAIAARREIAAVLGGDPPDPTVSLAIARAGNVVLPYIVVPEAARANVRGVPGWVGATALPVTISVAGREVPKIAPEPWLIIPAPHIATEAATVGHVNLSVDPDGTLRRHLPVIDTGEAVLPSLAVESARLALGAERADMVLAAGDRLVLDGLEVPLDRASRQILNHYGPEGSFETVSFGDFLDGRLEPLQAKGRIVLIGATASGAGDRFATPFATNLSGTEHLATAIGNLLDGDTIRRSSASRLVDFVAVLALAFLGAFVAGRRSLAWSGTVVVFLAAGWFALATLVLARQQLWLAVAAPTMAALLSAALVEGLRTGREQVERRRVEQQRANLARYFAPAIAERLAARNRPFELDRTETVAVMFVDLVGFTMLAEGMSPRAAMDLLRGFHTRVETAVFEAHGFVDKFIGDGALACFGVPDRQGQACADALRASRHLATLLGAWTAEERGGAAGRCMVGIGIHVGPVLMGDIGGQRQFQFTVIGDTVNVASRLERLTREHDAVVIASDAVIDAARASEPSSVQGFIPIGEVGLRGRHDGFALWRLPRGGIEPEPLRDCSARH